MPAGCAPSPAWTTSSSATPAPKRTKRPSRSPVSTATAGTSPHRAWWSWTAASTGAPWRRSPPPAIARRKPASSRSWLASCARPTTMCPPSRRSPPTTRTSPPCWWNRSSARAASSSRTPATSTPCAPSATPTTGCSCSTKCRPAMAAPGATSPTSTPRPCRMSSPPPRASATACPSAPAWRGGMPRRCWWPAPTAPPSAATFWRAPRPTSSSTSSKAV